MRPIYERMERECKIGPFEMKGGQKVPKPHQEYPKWVQNAAGKRVLVQDLDEEVRVAAAPNPSDKPDPLAEERRALRKATEAAEAKARERDDEITQMKAQLAELRAIREAPKPSVAPEAVAVPKRSSAPVSPRDLIEGKA